MAGVEIASAFFGISGAHIKSFNSRGVVAVSGKNREITREDVRRVVDQSKAIPIPPDRDIIHIIPQEFIVDDQDGIKDPAGMSGIKLEVNVHIITAALTSLQNLRSCVERAEHRRRGDRPQPDRHGPGRPDPGRARARRRPDRHRRRDDRGGHLRAGQPLVHLDHPHRRRQLHQRHRRRPADAHPGGRADQEEVRLHRRAARGRPGDDRGALGRQGPQAPGPVAPAAGRHHPAAGRGDLPAGRLRHQAHGLRQVAELGHRPHRRHGPARGPRGRRRGDLRPARPARRPERRRRPGRPRLDPRFLHGRGAHPLRLPHMAGPRSRQGQKEGRHRPIQRLVQGRIRRTS
ncbi:MAG: hypothetical protein MZV70_38020 [Desulfobacterales bacterium]|nr:hypothetical protein [Desulfobacterales bacterium]